MSTASSTRAGPSAQRAEDRGPEVESLYQVYVAMDKSVVNCKHVLKSKYIHATLQINKILDAGLDKQTIQVLLELLECGVHPEALADGNTLEDFISSQLLTISLFSGSCS